VPQEVGAEMMRQDLLAKKKGCVSEWLEPELVG